MAALIALMGPASAGSLEDVPAAVAEVANAVVPPPIDPASLDWSVLNFDPNTPAITAPDRSIMRHENHGDDLLIKRTERPDGSGAVSLGRRLPVEWDTKVGVDVGTAAPDPVVPEPRQPPAPLAKPEPGQSGAAWAHVTAPGAPLGMDTAAVDARIDPAQDRSKLGTTLSREVPLGGDTAMTLEGSSSLAETLPGGNASGSTRAQLWDLGNAVKLKLPTGTSLAAETSISSSDYQRHNSLKAEQTILGPLRLKSAVTDPGTTGSVNSIGAEYKRTW